MVTKPHIAVLSNQYLDSYCSNCFGPSLSGGLKRCTTCSTVRYCDSVRTSSIIIVSFPPEHSVLKECQKKDWPSHKHECLALQEWAKAAPSPDLALPSDAVRCLGRLMWNRQKKGSNSGWVCILAIHPFAQPTIYINSLRKSMRCSHVCKIIAAQVSVGSLARRLCR